MLGLELPPDDGLDAPPLDPDDPPEELGGEEEGREVDWLAQPPIRKAETVATAVTWPATTSTRFHEIPFCIFNSLARDRCTSTITAAAAAQTVRPRS